VLVLLDTCTISDFVKGDSNTLVQIKNHSPREIAVSAITLMEIEYGLFLNPAKAKKIRPILDEFLASIANNGLFRTLSIFKLLSEQGFSDGLS
jgi:tRNA(fMet)-specific endonuclease VapC